MSRRTPDTSNDRRVLGAHYSPRPVVDFVVARTVGELLRQRRWAPDGPLPRICDPACGAGVFLESGLDRLCRWLVARLGGAPKPGWLESRIRQCIFGVDVDPEAVRAARAAVRRCAVRWDPACRRLSLTQNIVRGNSLASPRDAPAAWRPVRFRDLFGGGPEPGRFDVVVGNPPFVDSEEMTRSAPELRRYVGERFAAAKGNWDLFCPFVERSLGLLASDGRLGLIVPNRLLAASYARVTRELLAEHDPVLLRDYSRVRLFDAAVYPLVVVARRRPRRRTGLRLEVASGTLESPRLASPRTVSLAEARRSAAGGWSALFHDEASPRAPLTALGEQVDVSGAASVAEAYRLQPLVREHGAHGPCLPLINTGTIDPYRSLWGRRALRFLGQSYRRPCVDARALEAELPRRAAQARAPKLVAAGLSRRLECVYDEGAALAGKSTSLIFTDAPLLWLALLNSAAASAMLRLQFGGLALAGRYLNVGPPQLRSLRVPDPTRIRPAVRRRLSEAAAELTALGAAGEPADGDRFTGLLAGIDAVAWDLFGLSPNDAP